MTDVDDRTAATGRIGPVNTVVLAALLDAIVIVGFATVGRASHGGAQDASQVLAVAAPFAAGAAIGWLVLGAARRWRRADRISSGAIVAAATLGVGLGYRIAVGAGAPAFLVVATLTLLAGLLGWRALVALVRALARRAASAGAR
ncbi:DUF3054 family protein [Naumannella huperziae]